MKISNLISLIKDLANVDKLHREYSTSDMNFVIDAKRDGNVLHFDVEIQENNKDKEKFEEWLNQLDDEIFTEIWESLSEEYGLEELNQIYESPNYKIIIDKFMEKAKEIAQNKVNKLVKLFGLE